MSLHKLTAGEGYTYLTRQVAALDATERGHGGLGDYYAQRGESPGTWAGSGLAGLPGVDAGHPVGERQMAALFGQGRHPDAERLEREALAAGRTPAEARAAGALGLPFLLYSAPADGFRARCAQRFAAVNAARGLPREAPLPAEERARIRSQTARGMFAVAFGRPPADARELSGFIARASRPATRAVAGWDLTFSPVKSVSALWALAPREVAEQVEAAHAAAVADTLAWLEETAAFTRLGAGGVRQVETTGVIAAVFTHRDSRAGDPDLHTHVAVSNKVQTRDGQWRALDGRVLHKANVAASERYNTRLEAHLVTRLGVRFAERPGGDAGKRPVREIVGVDPRLLSTWSSRRRAIDVARAALTAEFQAEQGRPPTAAEAIALAQQATLRTREAKHEPRSLAEQRAAWRRQALAVLGSASALTGMLGRVLGRPPHRRRAVTESWVAAAAARVLDTVSGQRASWQYWHVRAEAERLVRGAGLAPGDIDRAVARVTSTALSPAHAIPLGDPDPVVEPPQLRRSDGASVYSVAGARRYTSAAVLDAEALLLAAAGRGDGRRADPAVVELALLEATANGRELNPGQVQLVRDLARSRARVQLALAPAGTGKTTTLAALARAWTADGGSVLGLAPSAVATAGLREAIGAPCDTLAKLVCSLDTGDPPDWVAGIGPDTLVVVDEAGMAGTLDLARTVAYVLGRGGSVRLVGDSQQLASVAAGGVLAEIAATHGAVTLTSLVRFTDPAEAAATVALRDGDPTALGFYLDSGRVHVGDGATCAEQAYTAWASDRARGADALLLAATREVVQQLNERARADRLAALGQPVGAEVALADGTRAGAGDPVITRANDRRLPLGAADWVKNGDRWTVTAVGDDGALAVVHTATGRRLTLPAAYVRTSVQLGYAATVHGAQGVTADTCHTVLTGTESRQLLYVALTRGRAANHLYLATVGDGDPHSIVTPAAVFPPTATDLLIAILGRDGAQTSATGARRALADPAVQLHAAAIRYIDALRFAAEQHLGAAAAEELENAAEQVHPGLTAAAAWQTLRGHLALLACAGADPIAALTTAAAVRELGSAHDPAAVLDWRLPGSGAAGPLPWLPSVPTALADDPHWGPYLTARAGHLTACAGRVADTAATMTPATAPGWARPLLDPARASLRADLAVWRAALAVPDSDRRPTGPPQPAATARRQQRRLEEALAATTPARGGALWAALADGIDPRLRRDPHWPALADRLAAADRAGLDAAGLLAAVAAQRPLPDELPAAALWWRLAPHLAPATVATGPDGAGLRPDWCSALLELLPDDHGQRVLAGPAWPALVAAVSTGIRGGWSPADLLAAATAGLPTGTDGDPTGTGVAEALVFRVAALTDPAPVETAEPLPADLQPSDDADQLLPLEDQAAAVTVDRADPPPDDPDVPFHRGHDVPPPPVAPRYVTPDPFAPTGQPGVDDADYLLEQHFWATAAVRRDRLVELNAEAAAFFTDSYPGSWAPGYLRERLGTDLTPDTPFTPGYAPGGWTALVDHLRGRGATDDELLAAGLAQRARTGTLIDRFRDRLTFPTRDVDGVVRGFVARRNPAAAEDGRAGPKYLNTPGTDLYRKGEHLLGLHESRAALAAGAAPALVEGPLDAIALTLAGDGRTVGVALLGTALTDRQADLLRPHIRGDGPGVLVATDADDAGRRAAERMYWQLTARGDDPRRLGLPDGRDPADLLREGGTPAVQEAIDRAGSLAAHLLDARLHEARAGGASGPAVLGEVAAVVAATPPLRWLEHIDRVTTRLQLRPGLLHAAVLDASGGSARDAGTQPGHHVAATPRDEPAALQTPPMRPATDRRVSAPLARGGPAPSR
ncbi:DNA primase, catalytic core [Geodermatophilus aquaeductus]|uniref:DNA primase, catalytic core n=1 Tax=Geodermatophilus aquaeductus TaxID=1564161 RepID=A0A521F4T7_9ACTN|nr:MobF family relaxase [Geodermatophilus aquaeductus]SMO91173.1 DNA primase, catalytic core [Geodermatophilus aquaeductus]